MGLEALGAIAGGINKGMDWTQRDQEIKDQRAWREQQQAAWQEDREFQGSQRQRTIDEQGRSDKLREELGKIPQAGTEFTVPGTDVGPMEDGSATPGVKKTQTMIARAKQEGAAFQQAGDYKTAAERFKWANEEASKAAANSAVRALNSLPQTASLHDIVSAVAPVVDGDDSPVGIKTISKGEDGKSVRVQLYNKITGVTQEQDFADVPSLKRALTYHYAPDYARQLDAERAKTEGDILRERSKPYTLSPGAMRVDPVSGKTERNEAGFMNVGTEENPQYVPVGRTGTGATSSSRAPAATKTESPTKAASDAVKLLITESNTKMESEQIAETQRRAVQIAANGVPVELAAEVAVKVTKNPALAVPRVNVTTGKIDRVYEDQEVGEIVVGSDFANALKPGSVTRDQLKGFATQVVQAQPAAIRDRVVAAAFDPKARRDLEDGIRTEVNAAFKPKIDAAAPALRPQLEAQRDATIKSSLEATARKLDLIYNYGDKPKAASVKAPVGGIFQQQRQAAGAQDARQASYDKWVQAKSDKEELMKVVSRMSPDRREVYLASRLPEIEARIKEHGNYMAR